MLFAEDQRRLVFLLSPQLPWNWTHGGAGDLALLVATAGWHLLEDPQVRRKDSLEGQRKSGGACTLLL